MQRFRLQLVLLFALLPFFGLSSCGSSGGGGGGGGNPPTALDYGVAAVTFGRGIPITPITPTVTGTVDTYAVTAGTLPTGLALDGSTGVLSGTPTTIQAAAAVTITATNTDGGTSDIITFTVEGPASRALYAINNNEDVVGVFSVDPTSGRLNARGDVSGLDSPSALGISPDLSSLYVTNSANGTIDGFTIAAGTGDLTAIAGSPFAMTGGAGLFPNRIAFQPNGSVLYTANRTSGNVSMFDIGAGGVLTEKAGSPFGTLSGARDVNAVALSSGNYLYVTAPGAATDRLVAHSIATDGTLTQVDATTTGNTPTAMAATPAGDFLYLINEADLTVSGYAIDAADGTLTELGGSPFAIAGSGTAPAEICITDDGTDRNLYVSSINGEVSMFSIAGNGALSLLSPATVSGSGGLMTGIAASPNGENVYVCDTTAREILTYNVGFGGALAENLEIPQMRTQGRMRDLIVLPSSTAPEWNTDQLYAVSRSGNAVETYDVDSGGLLTAQIPTAATTSIQPRHAAIAKDGDFLYVTHPGDGTAPLLAVPLNTDGSLDTGSATAQAGTDATLIKIDPSGDFIYVVDEAGQALHAHPLDATGVINASIGSVATGSLPFDLAIDPTGRFAYVTNFASNTITQYGIDLTTGALSALSPASLAAPPGVRGITVHPSGRFVYASAVSSAGPDTDLIITYLVDEVTGALTAMSPAFTAAEVDPGDLVCTPDGGFLLAGNTHSSSSNISAHLINDFAVTGIQDGQPNTAVDTAATTLQPQALAISADGGVVYVGINAGTSVEAYTIDGSGMFTSLDAEATGGTIEDVVLRESRD